MVRQSYTSLSLTTAAAAGIKADALIVGMHSSDEGPFLVEEPTPVSPWRNRGGSTAGRPHRRCRRRRYSAWRRVAADRLVLVGLGEPAKLTPSGSASLRVSPPALSPASAPWPPPFPASI